MAAGGTVLDIDSDVEEVEARFEVDITEELKDEADLEGDEDNERIPKETEAYPALPPPVNPSSTSKAPAKSRQEIEKEATTLIDDGNTLGAIQLYTEAMRTGGSTAMMLATRAALLLKQRRPCAAIRDCTAAIRMNASMVKAYRIRGAAHRRLGHWRKAHRDLTEAQGLKFDASTAELQRFVSAQVLKLDIAAEKGGSQGAAAAATSPAMTTAPPSAEKAPEPPKEALKDLDKGQAVVISGLQKAPQLNGKRGVVERKDPRPAAQGRWEVELRMEGGKLEIKSLKRENIMTLNKTDKAACKSWAAEEKKHREERKQKEEREELAQYHKCVDSTMVKLPLSDTTRALLRQLHPKEALEIMDKAGDKAVVTNVDEFVSARAKLFLGQSDSDDEDPAEDEPGGAYDPEAVPVKRPRTQ